MADRDKAQENYEGYRYCRAGGHDDYLKRSELAYDFFAGRQWSDSEIAEMNRTNRPHLTINQMFRTLDSIVGEMLYSTGDVRFAPASHDANQDAADAYDLIYMNTMQRSKSQFFEPQLLLSGLLTGRAYYDVRVDFDNQMMGQIKVGYKRGQNIILNPSITSRDPNDWPEFYETRFTSLDEIELMYGLAARKEIEGSGQPDWLSASDLADERTLSMRQNHGIVYDPNRPDNSLLKDRRLIERQYRTLKYKEYFIDTQTGDMKEVPENWERERIQHILQISEANGAPLQVIRRKGSTIRWRVSYGQFILHDEDSPYNKFTIVPFMPWFIDGYTMSLGENLIDMQRMTNKLYSQYLHILNTAANSGWKVKKGSLQNMTDEELETKGATTGLVAVLDEIDDLERIQPGQLPSGHDHLASTVREMFNEVSGYTNTMQGADRADAAGKAIDAKISRGAVNLATCYNGIYHAKTLVAESIMDLAQTYYTETRFLRIQGLYGQEDQSMVLNQPQDDGSILNDITAGDYAVTVIPSPQRETVEQNAFAQLVEMRQELGIAIPDELLVEYSAIPNKKKLLEGIQNAGGTPEQQQQKAQQEQAMAQAELQDKLASADNSSAQAELARSRAGKAAAEAQRDPNQARLQMDAARLQSENERDEANRQVTLRKQNLDTATKLTDMKLTHERENKKIDVAAKTKATQPKSSTPKSKQPR